VLENKRQLKLFAYSAVREFASKTYKDNSLCLVQII